MLAWLVNPVSTLRSQKVMDKMPTFSAQGVEVEILNAGNQLQMLGTNLIKCEKIGRTVVCAV
jgi:hypothetical protein